MKRRWTIWAVMIKQSRTIIADCHTRESARIVRTKRISDGFWKRGDLRVVKLKIEGEW